MGDLLKLINYKVYYRTLSGYVRAVDGVNLTLKEGEILGVIGESGCGKTTLALSLVLPKPPLTIMGGSAYFRDIDLNKLDLHRRKELLLSKISLVPQYAMNALPIIKKIKGFLEDLAKDKKRESKEVIEVFKERAEMTGLPPSVVDMYPIELSGGMRQRVAIALATIFSPDLLIADEPTSSLDTTTQRIVLELLRELRDTGIVKSLIYITHDIATVRQIADKIAVMYAGKIVEVGPLEEVISHPLHPYTKKLLESVPSLKINYKIKRLRGLSGAPPSLFNPPSGCRFHSRCPYAQDICREKEPVLESFGNDHLVACWLYTHR